MTAQRLRDELWYFAELLVLTSFALAQPLLDVTGHSSDFFVYHRVSAAQVVAFVTVVVLVPPLLLWVVGASARAAGPRARRFVHVLTAAVLVTSLCYQGAKYLKVTSGVPLAVLGAAAGLPLTVRLARSQAVHRWFLYAVPAPLVFALLFVFTTPAGSLVRGGPAEVRKVALAAQPPIVMIFMDEFPVRALLDADGNVDARLFPNFARLASGSTRFTNATGVSGWTPFAVPAMLSGRFPHQIIAPSYLGYHDTLFTLLADSYHVHAYETITQLCPPERCDAPPPTAKSGLRPALTAAAKVAGEILSPYEPKQVPEQQFAEQTADASRLSVTFGFGALSQNQPERFTSFLTSLHAWHGEPALYFLHLLLPHQPHVYLPSGNRYPQSPLLDDRVDHTNSDQAQSVRLTTLRLLLQLVYTDHLLGQLLDELHRSGLWDKALFVLTADHGVGLVAGDKTRYLGARNPADLAWIPLFVKKPGQRAGAEDDRNYMHVDLLPTIADALGIGVPWPVDGISAFGPPRRTTAKYFYDAPRQPLTIDGPRWSPVAKRGLGSLVSRPDLGVPGLYLFGPHRRMVGRPVTAFPLGRRSGMKLRVAPSTTPDVDLSSGTVPAMTWGGLAGPGEQHTVVVAVNGVVAAVVDTFRGHSAPRVFGAIVSDQLFRQGRNEFRFYTLDSGALRPLRVIPG